MSDEELMRITKDFRDGILRGRPSVMMCAAVSWALEGFLNSIYDLNCKSVEGDLGHCNHVWIELQDGRVLDPTADQFNEMFRHDFAEVYLGPPLDIHPQSGTSPA